MAKKKYREISLNELAIRSDSKDENDRITTLFAELKDRINNGVELTENEKNFFCLCAPLDYIKYDLPENIPVCQDVVFKRKFLIYRDGLSENITRFRPNPERLREFIKNYDGEIVNIKEAAKKAKNEVYEEIPKEEAKQDLAELTKVFNSWYLDLKDPKQSNQFKKKVYKHTKELVDKEHGNSPEYEIIRKQFYLWSKYVYLMAKEVFEGYTESERKVFLNGLEIEFDKESFYHIIYNHYAPNTKTGNSNKSFFTNQKIEPRKILEWVVEVIQKIEASGKYKQEKVRKISINYQGDIYRIWINTGTRKDDGMTRFNQVGSVYPINDSGDLKDLKCNYKLVKIDEELSVYTNNCWWKFKRKLKYIVTFKFLTTNVKNSLSKKTTS